MSKRRKKNQPKKEEVRAHMPVQKPNESHMPECMAAGCTRRVSDARKPRCARCGYGASSQYDDFDMFNYGNGTYD